MYLLEWGSDVLVCYEFLCPLTLSLSPLLSLSLSPHPLSLSSLPVSIFLSLSL